VKKQYGKAIKDYDEAIRLDASNAFAYGGRGDAWYAQADYDKAIRDYSEAIRLNPKSAWDYTNRGNARYALKDFDKAIHDYNEAIRLDPKDARAFGGRGNAWYASRDDVRAVLDYDEAVRLGAQELDIHIALAWTLATSPEAKIRDGKRAVAIARKACEATKFKTAHHIDTLAAACAEAGQFDDAVRYAEMALADAEFARTRGDEARLRLEQYRQKIPFRSQ